MSLHLDLGIINKRIDSTGVAGFWKGTMLSNVLLKAPTSVINPTFIIDAGVEGTAEHSMYKDWPKYNYCYCSEFGRYYWIMDMKSISNRIVEIVCHVDVLASFKDHIGNLKDIFIKYTSKKALADFLLDDDRLTPQKVTSARVTNISFKDCDQDNKDIIDASKGTYIVKTKIVAPKYNFACVYAMNQTNFQKFCRGLRFVAPIPNAGEALAKAGGIGNISDYIEEVFWVPIKYDTVKLHGDHRSSDHMIIGPFVLQEYTGNSEDDWLAKLLDVESTDWQKMSLDYTIFADVDTNIIRSHKVVNIDYTYPIPKVGATEYGTDEKVSLSFLRGTKYTGLFFYHPCGVINLSDDALIGSVPSTAEGAKGGKLSINFMICPLTGTYSIRCYDYETHKFLGQGSGQIKIDMSGTTFGQGGWKTAQNKAIFSAISGTTGEAIGMQQSGYRRDSGMQSEWGRGMVGNLTGADVMTTMVDTVKKFGDLGKQAMKISEPPTGISGDATDIFTIMMDDTLADGIVSVSTSRAFRLEAFSIIPELMSDVNQYIGFCKKNGYVSCTVINQTIAETFEEANGYYIQCSQANFKQKEDEITYSDVHAATRNEISEINQFLNSGFYWEK